MTRNLLGSAILVMAAGLFQSTTVSAQTSYTPQVGDKVEYDGKMYEVTGSNLIVNGDFSDGFNGWTAADGNPLTEACFEVQPDGGPDGSPCIHALSSGGSSTAKSIKTGWAVEEGKTYVFSCWSWRSAENMKSNTQYSFLCYSDAATTASDKQKYTGINFTADKWTQTQVVFTAQAPYAVVNLGWLNQSSFDCFFLGEVKATADLVTSKLKDAIDKAKSMLAQTDPGTEYWQVSQEAYEKLRLSVAKAEDVLATATTQDELDMATEDLTQAINAFAGAYNALPDFSAEKAYTVTHYSGNLLTATDGEATITALGETLTDNQKMSFSKVDYEGLTDVYTVRSVSDGTYLNCDGAGKWTTSWVSEPTANSYLQVVRLDGKYLGLKFVVNKFLGSDNTDSGSKLYSDKAGEGNTKAYYIIEKVADIPTVISKMETAAADKTEVYTLAGRLVGNSTAKLSRGIYVVRTIRQDGTAQVSKVIVE